MKNYTLAFVLVVLFVPNFATAQIIPNNCTPTFFGYHPTAPSGSKTLNIKYSSAAIEMFARFSPGSSTICGNSARMLFSWNNQSDNFSLTSSFGNIEHRTSFSSTVLKQGVNTVKLQTTFDDFRSIAFEDVVTINYGTTGRTGSQPTGQTPPIIAPPTDKTSTSTASVGYVNKTDFDNPLALLFNPLFDDVTRPEAIVVRIINILLFLAASIAVLFIILGGFMMVTSAGNEDRVKQGKKTLIYAVAGLIVTLLSLTIVAIIQSIIS